MDEKEQRKVWDELPEPDVDEYPYPDLDELKCHTDTGRDDNE